MAKNEFTFEVIKNGRTTFVNQKFIGVSDPSAERYVYLAALRVWDNILSHDKNMWHNDFDFLFIKNAGYLIARHEIAQKPPGHEILAGVRYDEQGRLMSYTPKSERDY